MQKGVKRYFEIYAWLAAVGYGTALLLPGYLGKAPSAIFSFPISDGWCKVGLQSIGNHCFGDFYYPISTSTWRDPWNSAANPNPPLMQYFYKILQPLSTHGHSGLFIYLTLLIASVIVPLFYLFRSHLFSREKFAIFSFFICTSAPILIAMDRGSFSIVIAGIAFFTHIAYGRNQRKTTFLLFTILFLLKPQMVIFDLILVNSWKKKDVMKLIVIQVLTFLLSFALYPHRVFHEILEYFSQVTHYQNYVPWGALFPVNLSISTLPGVIAKSLFHPAILPNLHLLFTGALLTLAAIRFFMIKENLDDFDLLQLAVLLILLLPGVTFAYYLTLLLVPIFVGVKVMKERGIQGLGALGASNTMQTLLLSFVALLFIPWSIPWSLFFAKYVVGHAVVNTSMNWLFGLMILHLYFLYFLFRASSNMRRRQNS